MYKIISTRVKNWNSKIVITIGVNASIRAAKTAMEKLICR